MITKTQIAERLLDADTTVSMTGTVPSSGYCVADHGIHAAAFELNDVLSWLDSEPAAEYVGAWHDVDGTIYLDVVDVIDDLDTAVRIGRERGEIAIFDLATLTEIRL